MGHFNGWTGFLFKWAHHVRHAAQCLESSTPILIAKFFSQIPLILFTLVYLCFPVYLPLLFLLDISFSVYNHLLLSTMIDLIPLNPKDTFTVMCSYIFSLFLPPFFFLFHFPLFFIFFISFFFIFFIFSNLFCIL